MNLKYLLKYILKKSRTGNYDFLKKKRNIERNVKEILRIYVVFLRPRLPLLGFTETSSSSSSSPLKRSALDSES